MTLIEDDVQVKRELSAGELDHVAGGGVWKLGPPNWPNEPHLPVIVETSPQLGGGGLLKNPHMRLF